MKESEEYKTEVIKLITTMICQMCDGDPTRESKERISNIQTRYIEDAVGHIWETNKRKATITTVSNHFLNHKEKEARDLATLIKPFTKDGIYARFFEGESSIRLDNHFMVFELAELKNKKELQSIVLMFLVFLVGQNMYFGDRKTPITLLIDEAWDLLHGEGSRTFIEGMARRARKYCGNIVTGTQSVNDYYKNPATLAAWENTDWKILLAQNPESIELLIKSDRIVMTEALREALKSLRTVKGQYSEAVLYGPGGVWALVKIIFDPYSILVYSSSPDDWSLISDLRKMEYSLEDALEIIEDPDVRLVIFHLRKKEYKLVDILNIIKDPNNPEILGHIITQGYPEKNVLEDIQYVRRVIRKKRIFDVSDYVQMMSLKDEGKEFEDALEIVAAKKFRNNPTYQQQMTLQ